MSVTDVLLVVSRVGIALLALTVVVLSLVWLERKTIGRIQRRMGPMRVGFHGILQPFADALKLIVKEDVIPGWADKWLFWAAPLVVFIPAFMVWVTIPFAKDIVVRNMERGLLFIIAFSVLAIAGMALTDRAEAVYLAGEMLMKDGRDREAHSLFKQAVSLDPENVGARRRIRLQESRKGAEEKNKPARPLFGGLFGRRGD